MSRYDNLRVNSAYRAFICYKETNDKEQLKRMRDSIGLLSSNFIEEYDFFDWVGFYTKTGSLVVALDLIETAGSALIRSLSST